MIVINGLVISGALEELLDKNYPHAPIHPECFSQLVEPHLPENVHDLIGDFKFHPKGLIELETMGLYKWLGCDSEIMMLGKVDELNEPGNIDPGKSIFIGDFGYGSDMGIVLDYREDIISPRVLIDVWGKNPRTDNRWVTLTNTVEEFLQKNRVCELNVVPKGTRKSQRLAMSR